MPNPIQIIKDQSIVEVLLDIRQLLIETKEVVGRNESHIISVSKYFNKVAIVNGQLTLKKPFISMEFIKGFVFGMLVVLLL